jgi:uncharacterized protein with HEPN domain
VKHPERVSDYLENIAEAVDRAIRYVEGMEFAAFEQDPRTQDAVVRNLEIIGEAATRLHQVAPDYTDAHQEIPWSYMRGMRNIIAHEYWRVDLEVVWRTALNDLPDLLQKLHDLLRRQQPGEQDQT